MGWIRIAIILFFGLSIELSYAFSPVAAIQLRSLGQYSQDAQGDRQLPFSQYAHLYTRVPEIASTLSVDFRYALDLNQDSHHFDLYQGHLNFAQFGEVLELDAGRISLAEGIDYFLVDGAHLHGVVAERWDWGIYGGWTRDTHLNPIQNAGRLVGGRVAYLSNSGIRNQLGFLLENYNSGATDQRISFALGYNMLSVRHWSIDSGVEYSVAGENLALGFLTQDFGYSKTLHFHLGYYFRNPLTGKQVERDPIYEIFAISGSHNLRHALSYFFNDWLAIEPAYELSSYDSRGDQRRFSHRAGIDLFLLPNDLHLKGHARYAYWRSYGGDNHLTSLTFGHWISSSAQITAGGEVAFYRKITNESAKASRTFIDAEFHIVKELILRASFEVISNEDTDRDFRFTFMLESHLGSGV